MADLLSLGTQGVRVAQRQLNTTGHNIANTNTEGYSRQTVEQQTAESMRVGGHRWGTGVSIKDVYRNYDKFAINELNIATSLLSHAQTRNDKATILDEMMAFSAKKIPDNLNQFFGSLNALIDTPNDIGARKVVLENAKMVSNGFNSINSIFHNQVSETNEEIKGVVARINDIARELAEVQRVLIKRKGEDNTLLDKHQTLINELSEYTQVTVNRKKNGSYNVLIGTGHTLVSGTSVSQLTTIANAYDSQTLELALISGESVKPIHNEGIGGQLGALFEYQNTTIKNARNELGLLAMSFAMQFNELQTQGYDLKEQVGKNLFKDFNDPDVAYNRVIKKSNSSADLSVFIDDLTKLKSGDYKLKFDGSQYTLVDPDDISIKVTPTSSPSTINAGGLTIKINEDLASAETVIIRPIEYAAGQITMELAKPEHIAAQSYVTSSSNLSGSAQLKVLSKGSQKAFQVVMSSDGKRFSVLDMDDNVLISERAYPKSGNVVINGTEFSITEGAKKNDRFVVSFIPADGDNSNLLKMQALQTKKMLYQNSSTLLDVYEKLNTDIGIEKASFERLEIISRAEYDAAQGRVSEISGVNLDEEATNMIKFQQAYMASSRILLAADEMFQTLLSIGR